MSETTQILFNSPALHSLKRDQLVKLCKIHSLKASGKNTEIIERLKTHAHTLPSSDPLSVAARSEQPADDDGEEDMSLEQPSPPRFGHVRPSEQWEIVMDDIEEESSSRGGTLNSLRTTSGQSASEFGTGSSRGVTSSIKAIATSLGLKRAPTSGTSASMKSNSTRSTATSSSLKSLGPHDDLAHFSTPYDSIPEPSPSNAPLTDHFTLTDDPDTSLPGYGTRAGVPAPQNARLSTGAGPTTTIRLVSMPYSQSSTSGATGPATPQLKPFSTKFDLLLGSPGGDDRVPVWPPPLGGTASPQRLYPTIPSALRAFSQVNDEDEDVPMPGAMTPPRINVQTPARSTSSKKSHASRTFPTPSNGPQDIFSPAPAANLKADIPRSTPFIFGSPLPQNNVSNKAFGNAASSVLEEMNRRLSAAGAQKVASDIFEHSGVPAPGSSGIASDGQETVQNRFARVHEEEFKKMDSIANHYAARRGANKRKSEVLGKGAAPSKKRVSAETRVISAGARKRMGVPGGFGDDDDDDDNEEETSTEENRRMSKRVRVSEIDGGVAEGRRISIAPTEKEKRQREKERDAVRKALDVKREKRRSSIRPRVSGVAPPPSKSKGTGSRFGFLSSAKSMVRTVWNMGAGGTSKAVGNSNIPVPKAAPATATNSKKEAKVPPKAKPSLAASRPSKATVETANRVPSGTTTGSASNRLSAKPSISAAAASARSRSPLPVFGSTSTRSGAPPSGHSRTSSITSITSARAAPPSSTSSRLSTRPGSISGPSSIGTKGTTSTRASSAVSSIGTRKSMAPPAIIPGKTSMSSFGKVSSRLFAPTASSLAKTRASAAAQNRASGSIASRAASPKASGSALDQITNSPPRAPAPRKDTPGKIFSKPLSAAGSPSLIPSPVRPTSLAGAASTLAGVGSPRNPVASAAPPSKPKLLPTRKPRISRSRVIAKLGAKRAAAAGESDSAGVSAIAPRTRSSVGGARRSFGGMKSGKTRNSDVLVSAKKRARQSEYMRRRSRAAGSAAGTSSGTRLFSGGGDGSMSMDLDND
ncbi:hypothetical protein FA95DRAFT_1555856 [Auriscalpium vulgare]|uniref:Uncharacterized protein n=1 Tax=Auriscalpium vulgare TaxID=40419 RepID=A0ACB8S1J0_9AGAM|nr:hypothetical protein FA95DRAFT_1555856 [Auriscalpium vulgare]